jgi:hypothetical protein
MIHGVDDSARPQLRLPQDRHFRAAASGRLTLLAELPGRSHQAVDRGAGQGGDVLGGQIPGDSFIEEDVGLGGKFLVSAPQDMGDGHPGQGEKAGGGVAQRLGLASQAPGHLEVKVQVVAEGFQQGLFGPGDEGGPVKTAFRDLAKVDAPAGEGLSRGVEQVVQNEDLLRQGDFLLTIDRGDADLRPGNAPGLAEIGHQETVVIILDKELGAAAGLQALGVDLLQGRHRQGQGGLIIIDAGHTASFMGNSGVGPGPGLEGYLSSPD